MFLPDEEPPWPRLTLSLAILRLMEGLDELVERNNAIGRDWREWKGTTRQQDNRVRGRRKGTRKMKEGRRRRVRERKVALEGYAIASMRAPVFSVTGKGLGSLDRLLTIGDQQDRIYTCTPIFHRYCFGAQLRLLPFLLSNRRSYLIAPSTVRYVIRD